MVANKTANRFINSYSSGIVWQVVSSSLCMEFAS